MSRRCGECKVCCTVLPVRAIDKAAGEPCAKLCASGCSIFDSPDRPEVCGKFRCAWLQGNLGPRDRPDRSGALVWMSHLTDTRGRPTDVMQANFKPGKRNKKIMHWLMRLAYPVMVTQSGRVELYIGGRLKQSWDADDKLDVKVA